MSQIEASVNGGIAKPILAGGSDFPRAGLL